MNKRETKIEKIEVLNSGGVTVSLELLTYGSGTPRTLILSGIHGTESSGQLVIANLLENLPEFSGTLTVLPIANPLGYAMEVRQEPLSDLDLNRQFTGKNDGRPAFRIAAEISKLAQQQDYVIDLHGYTTAGLIQVGCSVNDDSAKIAELLNPDVIRASHVSAEYKINGALSGPLRKAGISYVLVELPPSERISLEQIDTVASGLVAHLIKCLSYASYHAGSIWDKPFVRIKLIKAAQSGVFRREVSLRLGDKVNVNDTLGNLLLLSEYTEIPVVCPYEGMICEMETVTDDPVAAGETLFGIGEILTDEEKQSLKSEPS